jgi:hypothetical protein
LQGDYYFRKKILNKKMLRAPNKLDFEIAALAFSQYCDDNILPKSESYKSDLTPETPLKRKRALKLKAQTAAKRMGIYLSCVRRTTNQSPRRLALQILVERSRIYTSTLIEYVHLDVKQIAAVIRCNMTEEEIERSSNCIN